MSRAKTKSAALTVALMMGATVVSKVLGLIRNTLLASHYGTSEAANAFSVALRVPLSFFDLLFSAAIVACFVPVFNGFREEEGREADEFASVYLNTMLLLSAVAAVLGILLAPELLTLIAPGLPATTHALAVRLIRVLFPMVIFAAGTYTVVGVLQSKGSFLAPAAISAVSNLGVILYFLFLDRRLGEDGIYGLALAYLLSWFLQLAVLIVPLWRCGFAYRPILAWSNPHLRRALRMVPLILVGSWLLPASSLVGTFFGARASLPSAISVFDYANNIYIIVAGILTYSISNFLFPRLSRLSGVSEDDFAHSLAVGLRATLYLILPVLAAVLVLTEEGVCVLYLGGSFTGEDARNVAITLRAIAAGMPAFALSELLSRAFYSRKELLPPALAAVLGVLTNVLVCAAVWLLTGDVTVAAIGAGNAAGQWVCALTLLLFSAGRLKGLFRREALLPVCKTVLAAAVALGVMLIAKGALQHFGWTATDGSRLTNAAVCLGVFLPGLGAYFATARLTKLKFR